MAKTFEDDFLMNYSLVGFKKKKPFSKLFFHRVIIGKDDIILTKINLFFLLIITFCLDSVRMHIKYKSTPEKEIETPLSVWMSHAKFRIKSKEDSNAKKMKLV